MEGQVKYVVDKPAKHTPGPWKIKLIPNSLKQPEIHGPPAKDGSDYAPICTVSTQADAEFITMACNSHDAMLDACKAGIKALMRIMLKCDIPDEDNTIRQIQAAINQADKA